MPFLRPFSGAKCGNDLDGAEGAGAIVEDGPSANPPSTTVDETACADIATLSAAEKTCTSDNQCTGLEDTNFGSDCDGNRAEHK